MSDRRRWRPRAALRTVTALALGTALLVPASPTPVALATLEFAAGAPLAERVEFGAFVDGMTARPARLDRYQRRLRTDVGIASYYYGYGDVFPGPLEERFSDGDRRKVLLSWDPGTTRFTEWASGEHDGYLDQIVAAATAYPYDVYIRPWPEMNGDWSTFQPTVAGDRPHGGSYREFKRAWRHVVRYTRAGGATNLRWVFNPAADTYPETTPVERIWPGRRYVDVLGIDGFNWGADDGWGRWRSFRDIFAPMYRKLVRLHPSAPVWICEFGSKEPAVHDGAPADPRRDKGTWIRRAFGLTGMPRLEAMIYFDIRKERDWRAASSPESLRAMRRALR